MTKGVIVIGDGLSEIVAVIRMAQSGYSVSLDEQNNHIDWSGKTLTQQIKKFVYRNLTTIEAFDNVQSHIVSETIFTPYDFEQTYHAKFGSAFGLMPTLAQSNYYRPQNVSRDYKHLYFAGASTHPGAGAFLLS